MTKKGNILRGAWDILRKATEHDIEVILGKKYRVWVVNTKKDFPLFTWENWKHIYPLISQLLELVDDRAYIRTFQSFENENRWLGFGRMSWSEENNVKWTSKYRKEEYGERELTFFSTEVWAPDWNECLHANRRPNIFVNIYHLNFEDLRHGLLIAIPLRIVKKHEDFISARISAIQQVVDGSAVSLIDRYWTPGRQFPNHMDDMNPHELMKIIQGVD